MRIAAYFPTAHLKETTWADVVDGKVALSGTDGQLLRLVNQLARTAGEQVSIKLWAGPRLRGAEALVVSTAACLAEAVEAANGSGSDVILFNDRNDTETLAGLDACSLLGLRAIVWAQNGPFGEIRERVARYEAIRRVVCVSQWHADCLRGHAAFEKAAVIHNALSPSRAPNSVIEARSGVMFLGATVYEKGFHIVARAWPAVRGAHPAATLTVLGSGQLYDREAALGPWGIGNPDFEQRFIVPFWGSDPAQAEQLGIHVLGLQPPNRVREELRRHLIAVVNPWASRGGSSETFCVSAIEAASEGCAVVGGRRLGLRETVQDGRTGILLRREGDLSRVLIRLVERPDRARELGERGRAWVCRQFAQAKVDAQWKALLADVVADRAPNPPRLALGRLTSGTLLGEARRWLRLVRNTRASMASSRGR